MLGGGAVAVFKSEGVAVVGSGKVGRYVGGEALSPPCVDFSKGVDISE